ncbi:MAG TPA: formyltransferase family protein [Gaiellaceae bacterium]|nr:formyltransferase family protein [Gaiellaceae bacterium]
MTQTDIPGAPWRVGVISQIAPLAVAYADILSELGHKPVVHLATRRFDTRQPVPEQAKPFLSRLMFDGPPGIDLVFPANRKAIAPLLRAYDLDIVVCTAFPWLLPVEALAAPRLGILNGHPSKLPHYRGPMPFGWQIRGGESEIGFTYHLMDAEFDTGAMYGQGSVPFTDDDTDQSLWSKLTELCRELLPAALARIAAGDPGDPQGEGSYHSLFEDDYVLVDPAQTAAEVHRQVRAWAFTPWSRAAERGPVLERASGRIRIVRSSLVEVEGAERLDCADAAPLWILESEPA